jgi:hypothetical protein
MGFFCRVQNVRVALAVAVAGAALFCSTGALAQTASGTGVETSAGEDMPDYPIPAKAREAYSPQGVDAVNPQTKAPLPNRDVLNLRLDYEPHGGALEGLRVQIYYSDEKLIGASEPRDDQTQFRACLNQSLHLALEPL